jgi:hypothetical protein
MPEPQERMQQIASAFGASDIKIFIGRDKVFPDKPVSEAKVQQLEDALRSPEKEMSSIRITESNKTIYRSHEGAVTADVKGVAEQFQPTPEPQPVTQPTQTKDEQIRAAVEPKLVEQMSEASKGVEPGGAIVHINQSKAVIPIEPTPPQLNEQMPAMVTPSTVSEQPSLEQSLAAANTRIDSLQKQLDSTTASVQNLSAQIKDRSLKGWAQNTVQKIDNTIQTFAVQAKANVVQWVNTGLDRIQQKAEQLKDVAQKAVGDVKMAAQVKTIEVKQSVREKVNDFLSPVDSAALTKAADRMINQWGHAGRFEGNTFDFQRSSAGEISIHTKNGIPVFEKGTLTNQADAKTVAHLAQIPRRVELVQNRAPAPEKTAAKQQAFAR